MAFTSPKMTATASRVRTRSLVVPGPTEMPSIRPAATASATAPARIRTINRTGHLPSRSLVQAEQGDHTKPPPPKRQAGGSAGPPREAPGRLRRRQRTARERDVRRTGEPAWNAAIPARQAASRSASGGNRWSSSSITMPWANAQTALARAWLPATRRSGAAVRFSSPGGRCSRGSGPLFISR